VVCDIDGSEYVWGIDDWLLSICNGISV
jgi:hypothetical protein